MAILKDTTILGDARVTDTLYANNQQVDTLTTSLLNINTTSSAAAATLTQLDFTDDTTSYGVISANTTGAMTFRSKRILAFFAAQSSAATAAENYQSTNGVYIGNGLMWPEGDMDLGTPASRWNKIYTKAVAVGSNTNDTTYPFYVYNTQARFSLGTSNYGVADRKFTIAGGSGTNINELSFGNEAIQAYTSTQAVKNLFLQPRGGNLVFGQAASVSTTSYSFYPNQNNKFDLGSDSYKWKDVYATTLHGSLTLTEVTGADDLKAIEALSGTSGLLKKTAENTWALDTTTYSTLTLGTTAGAALAATASAGTATTAAKSDHVHPLPTAAQVGAATDTHTHGNITNAGCITTAITPAANDYLIIGDNSASGKLGKGPTFVSTTANKFLKDTGAFTAIAAADLPAATTSAKGAVIVGTGLSVSSGTVSVAYGTSANTALEGDTDINKVKQNATSTANTDYPILLAASADTTLQTDYVNKSATLIYNPNSKKLSVPFLTITDTTTSSHIAFSRDGWSYLTAPATGNIAFNFGTIGSDDSTLSISATDASPGKTNTYSLGTSGKKWSAVYATTLHGLWELTTLTSSTINSTAGTYGFYIASTDDITQISSSSLDYVGIQVGNTLDKWQITAVGGHLWVRENDSGGTNTASWTTWTQCLDRTFLDTTIPSTIDAAHIPSTQAVVDYVADNAVEIIRL